MSSGGNVSRTRMRGIVSTGSAAPGDGGNDRDLVAVLERGLLRLEEPDVLLVDVDIDESPQLAGLVHESFLQPRELALQVVTRALTRLAFGWTSALPFVIERSGVGIRTSTGMRVPPTSRGT